MSQEIGEVPATPDGAAMEAFYGCSESAFEALVARWRPRLFGFFRRRDVDVSVEDAEDLVLLTLVKLYVTKERRSFDLSQPLAPFLFQVAVREHIAWRRRTGREIPTVPWIEALDLALEPADPHPALSADLRECIERLPPAEQEYVMLCGRHGLGDLSHNEIAECLEKWPAQVTLLSKRARALLEECLRTKGYR